MHFPHVIVLTALIVLASSSAVLAGDVRAAQNGRTVTLDNGRLRVVYDGTLGEFSASCGGRTFLRQGRAGNTAGGETKLLDVRDELGTGKALRATGADGAGVTLTLYDALPFVCVKSSRQNDADRDVTLATLETFEAVLDLGDKAALRMAGPDGSHPVGEDRSYYCYAAVAQPKNRAGAVCGYLTHFRGSGVVTVAGKEGPVKLSARSEFGRLRIPAGAVAESETAVVGYFDDALSGLEAYADAVARAHKVRLPPRAPNGYCTWYHAGPLDEKRMAELAEYCKANLTKFGLDVLQIDDGWQAGPKRDKSVGGPRADFTAHNPSGPYAHGMKATAEAISAAGMWAGIWLLPFAWDPRIDALKDHPDWFVHREDGEIYFVRWAGWCLDMTHPASRDFLAGVINRLTKDWGYRYLKLDGLWSGLAAKIRYPNPAYGPDDLGDAVFHDPGKTNVEAYRLGLETVRRAAGDDVFLLGCNIAQNVRTLGASIGFLDGMRIGPDVGANWHGLVGGAKWATNAYFWNARVWYNDPDCLMLRDPLTTDQARAWGSLIGLSGQMVLVSEWLPKLQPERLEVLKRLIPNPSLCGRPVDLFEEGTPKVWHLRADLDGRRDLVALFNWDEKKPADVGADLADLRLPAGGDDRYVGFDFWEDRFVEPFSGRLRMTLRPSSCRVVALARLAGRPQLLSTSRHITQGMVDVSRLKWDPAASCLTGVSAIVAGDTYELRVYAPGDLKAAASISAEDASAGTTVETVQDGPHVRVRLACPQSRPVAWRVEFK